MQPREIKLAGFVGESITDGPGLRAAVFVQGCPHRCPGCHNPGSHDFEAGTDTPPEELFARIAENPLLSGVTFTGGEPMCQAAALAALARRIRNETALEIAVYTGYTWEELAGEGDPDRLLLLSLTDILVDGPFVLAQRSLELKFRGSQNQRILNVPASRSAGAPVWETSPRWV